MPLRQHRFLPQPDAAFLHPINISSCPKSRRKSLIGYCIKPVSGMRPMRKRQPASRSIKAMSRSDVKLLCESVLGIRIATGTIQKILDHSSEAIRPTYDAIGEVARSSDCNYIDETSWFKENALQWLLAMVNSRVAFPYRSSSIQASF